MLTTHHFYTAASAIAALFSVSGVILDRLVGLVLARLTTDREVEGSIPGTSTNFKCGLDLERGPPSLVRTIEK